MNLEKVVWHTAKRYEPTLLGMDKSLSREDLLQEGMLLAAKMNQDWTPYEDEIHFIALFCTKLRAMYVDWVRKLSAQKRKAIEFETETSDQISVLEKYMSLPKELQIVVKAIVEAPEEVMQMAKAKSLRYALRKWLRRCGIKDAIASTCMVLSPDTRRDRGWLH